MGNLPGGFDSHVLPPLKTTCLFYDSFCLDSPVQPRFATQKGSRLMSSYLLNREHHYHFRIRIPSDFASLIPGAELVKSLKTKDKFNAKAAASTCQQGILKVFSLTQPSNYQQQKAINSLLLQ